MSLVREALRKAEREAAARRRRELGLPEPAGGPLQPFRQRRGHGWAVGLGLGVLGLLIAVVGGWLLLGRPGFERRKIPLERTAAVASPAAPGSGETRAALASPMPGSRATTSPIEDRGAPQPMPRGPAAGSLAEETGSELAPPSRLGPDAEASFPAPRRPERALAAPPPPPESTGDLLRDRLERPGQKAAGRETAPREGASSPEPPTGSTPTYVREAPADVSGVAIRLGGIAWSESAPLAYLNGKLLGPGETVAGWRIERIERGGVLLARGTSRLRLTLP